MKTDGKKKILFIDDDEFQHKIVENMLQDDFDIIKTKSGTEALDYLYTSGFIPNLILLDILMPKMNGWEVFNRIRAVSLLKSVPIVFLTAVSGAEDEQRALSLGAKDFITKPYEKEAFVDRIKKVLEK